jgi:hypothetical protein
LTTLSQTEWALPGIRLYEFFSWKILDTKDQSLFLIHLFVDYGGL